MVSDEKPSTNVMDLNVFIAFTFLHIVLLCAGGIALTGTGIFQLINVWFWVFAFPVMLVNVLWELDEITFPLLLLLNAPIYGAMWCFAWRRFRRKRR